MFEHIFKNREENMAFGHVVKYSLEHLFESIF